MKKLISIMTVAVFVLMFGTAYAGVGMTGGDADSLIFTLDPSSVPGYENMESGAITLAPKSQFTVHGSAAGGTRMAKDTLLNDIDPSGVAGYVNPDTGDSTPAIKASSSTAGVRANPGFSGGAIIR